jgi:hypothetical protein
LNRYYISQELKGRIIAVAGNRCGYCHLSQDLLPIRLTIEHITPRSAGGSSEENNLWLSCSTCNNYKGSQIKAVDPRSGRRVKLFNPRTQRWSRHFRWSEDGMIIVGKTAADRTTVEALQLNNELALTAQRFWMEVGRHPMMAVNDE